MARKKTIADDELLQAAREVFVRDGIGGSTRKIARIAGVSEGLLFQRYGTKADLFFAAMVPPPLALKEQIRQPVNKGEFAATLQRLGAEALAYFRKAAPVLLQLMSHPAFKFEDFAERHPNSGLVAMRMETMQFFAVNRAADPAAAALVFLATLHGIVMFERLGAHGGVMPQEFVERSIDLIANAVRPD